MIDDDLSDEEYQSAIGELDAIQKLVDQGVLGNEKFPEPAYCHWSVLKPDELPLLFKTCYNIHGEVRWYK